MKVERAFSRVGVDQRPYSVQPDWYLLRERTGLPYARDNDDRAGRNLGPLAGLSEIATYFC